MAKSMKKTNCESNSDLYLSSVSAGFPSPADDYREEKLDLNEYLVKNKLSTFFVRAKGESMKNAGIMDGDLLVVDKSIEVANGQIVIAVVDGEFTVKRLVYKKGEIVKLIPENENYKEIVPKDHQQFEIWGVVTSYIHKL